MIIDKEPMIFDISLDDTTNIFTHKKLVQQANKARQNSHFITIVCNGVEWEEVNEIRTNCYTLLLCHKPV